MFEEAETLVNDFERLHTPYAAMYCELPSPLRRDCCETNRFSGNDVRCSDPM